MYYNQDYISYKDKQESRLCCMRCNTVLKERVEKTLYEKIDEQTYKPVVVTDYQGVEKYARVVIPVKMGNGGKGEAGAILCIKCSTEPLDNVALIKQIKRGWLLEMQAHGKTEEEIKEYMDGVGNISPFMEVYIV